jgi:hypothetical protein
MMCILLNTISIHTFTLSMCAAYWHVLLLLTYTAGADNTAIMHYYYYCYVTTSNIHYVNMQSPEHCQCGTTVLLIAPHISESKLIRMYYI